MFKAIGGGTYTYHTYFAIDFVCMSVWFSVLCAILSVWTLSVRTLPVWTLSVYFSCFIRFLS